MTKWLKSIMGEALFKQSAIVFIGTIFVNVANLVFWLYMVRALTPADYATLNSLIALMALFSVPLNITQIVITRYVSKFIALDRQIDVIALVSFLSRIISLILIPIFFFFVFFSSNIGDFLKIKAYGLIFLSGMGVVFGSFSSITMGALSGLQRFKAVSLNSAATGLTKLSMGISLVSLKMGVLGALLGFVSSLIFSLFFSLFQLPKWLKDFWKNKSVFHLEKKDIFNYFIPIGLST
ncbi:MAG TPA: oligosaccharide flippase family protein, partial [Candidatus Omnitrophota bacterium]|nr:oligosaccharide flippase family protein [Candidatus Omnitrophota bacterium]